MTRAISKSLVHFLSMGFIVLTSCAYGPQTKDTSPLEALNGKHYEVAATGSAGSAVVPIVKRRRANVRISGRVGLNQNGIPLPLVHQTLVLVQDSKILAVTKSEANGAFTFLGDFLDGPAIIRLESTAYSAEYPLQIKGFAMENIDFLIKG